MIAGGVACVVVILLYSPFRLSIIDPMCVLIGGVACVLVFALAVIWVKVQHGVYPLCCGVEWYRKV